jgi:hypothetical protein
MTSAAAIGKFYNLSKITLTHVHLESDLICKLQLLVMLSDLEILFTSHPTEIQLLS